MTIRNDAGEILYYIYKCKIDGKETPRTNQLLTETGWNEDRLNNSIQYLIEGEFVRGQLQDVISSSKPRPTMGNITNKGINIFEEPIEFKNTFGVTLNLGVVQLSWGKQEK